MLLPRVPQLATIAQRLPEIFPPGTEHRNYVIRDMAARTIFVMFYAGAIEGSDRWIRPSQVTDMTDIQAATASEEDERLEWIRLCFSTKKPRPADAWYAANSREPVRDETIRTGLIPTRAVIERLGVATTSSLPKYALESGFAALFDEELTGQRLATAITAWQKTHLTKAAIARLALMKKGVAVAADAVPVTFPNGEARSLCPGPSSVIAKAVIEDFAPRFLAAPAVLWLSESGNKVVARDEHLADVLGISIDAGKALPDVILVDLGTDQSGDDMMVVFCEVVATDGPINRQRQAALTAVTEEAGLDRKHVVFLTAFADRGDPAFRKASSDIAWDSFVWCASEPNCILHFRSGNPTTLWALASQ